MHGLWVELYCVPVFIHEHITKKKELINLPVDLENKSFTNPFSSDWVMLLVAQ